jgi:hypothetical protein
MLKQKFMIGFVAIAALVLGMQPNKQKIALRLPNLNAFKFYRKKG